MICEEALQIDVRITEHQLSLRILEGEQMWSNLVHRKLIATNVEQPCPQKISLVSTCRNVRLKCHQ